MKKDGARALQKSEDLADAYLNMLRGKKLYPPLQNYSAFMLGSGFHTKIYCRRWYGAGVRFDILILMKDGFSQVWLPEEYMKLTSEIGLREHIRHPRKFRARLDSLNQPMRKMDALYLQYQYKRLSRMRLPAILSLVKRLRGMVWSANAPTIAVNYLDKEMCWSILQDEGYGLSRNEFDDLWEKAVEPAFESIDKVQMRGFLTLIHNKTPWEMVVEECQYMLTDYHSAKDLATVGKSLKETYAGYVQAVGKIPRQLLSEAANEKKRAQQHEVWLRTLSRNQRNIAEYVQEVMRVRDRRKIFINKGLTIIYRIAEKMFQDAGISRLLIPYYTMDELLRGPRYLIRISSNLEKRKRGFELLVAYSGQVKMLNAPIDGAVNKMNVRFLESQKNAGGNSIRGQIGSPGVARGRVRIVFDVHADHGFRQDEILVTGMTRPEFVPLMRKAAAIVTDEGGITCHAAIVSRELKIPCIIGTKIATQVLKDGDMVEVDANKGTVKVLKKKH